MPIATTTMERVIPRRPVQYTQPGAPPPAPLREPTAVIAELLRRRVAPTCSREERAFIDGQRGGQQ
jgi:hypothetical protein